MGRLDGKVALITGASSGIGRATALLFAKEGAAVVLVARRPELLKETEAEITALGAKALSVSADVSDPAACQRAVDETVAAFGRIDILVNNAGIADKHRPITRTDHDWWRHIIAVNQDSVYYMTKAALVHMEQAGRGSVVTVSSIGGTRCNSGIAYTAAKTAVIGMTRNMAIQFAGTGIRFNAIAPGPTPTALNAPEQLATFDSEFAGICGRHMDGTVREATAQEQAQAILFFASDDSSAVTGQVLVVDCGCSL